jgi:biopolymer transport protein ExbD
MSHGGGGGDKPLEPNLTPLLDLVLQLVMFFMLCANFVSDQISRSVVLPNAVTAKSLDAEIQNVLYVNLNDKGNLILQKIASTDEQGEASATGEQLLIAPIAIQRWLRTQFDDKARASGKKDAEEMVVIIRAHKDCTFEGVFMVMSEIKKVGFKRMQLRAIQKGKSFAQGEKS